MRLFDEAFAQHKAGTPVMLAIAVCVCFLNSTSAAAAGSVAYVQGNYSTPQSPQTSVTVTFTAAQVAGDLNVVVAGWNDSQATVKNVTDTAGNVYSLAVGPTVVSGAASQSIYYASNVAAVAAGANKVTVTFSTAATSADIRILEYSGVAPISPVDVTAASSGSSATSSSGAATTTNATDLIFGANLVLSMTTGPGSGFTSRLLTAPDGDIAEDQAVTSVGSYIAAAPVSPSNSWIMQMVAFKVGSAISACDLNADGAVNILDVQLATDMDLGATPCTGPAGLCNVVFVQDVLNSVLGQPCVMVALSATPSTMNFGNVTVNGTGTQSVQLTAAGSGTTIISQVTVTPSIFGLAGLTLPLSLPAGQSASFNVTFKPTATGSASGSLAIVSSALDSTVNVPISGTGVTVTAHSASLSWTASNSPNIAGYNVYRISFVEFHGTKSAVCEAELFAGFRCELSGYDRTGR